jgi:LPS O-antigen subunit length determinant protein (WzzB/FepE family)
MKTDDINSEYFVININELFRIAWKKKVTIFVITMLFAVFSVMYALSLSNIYTSSTILAPTHKDDSLSSRMASYSSLASIAGVPLNTEINKSQEAIEIIKSLDFFTNHFLPFVKPQDLLAAKSWSYNDKKITYDEKIFDEANNAWVMEFPDPKKKSPSSQDFYSEYRKILSINEDKKTTFVNISIKHISPQIAYDWLNIIITNINSSMQEQEKSTASNAIKFLNNAAQETSIKELKEAITSLLESQLQKLMLASAETSYVFKKIDSPYVPEKKTSPNRAIICISITFIGGIIGILVGFFDYYRKKIY